MDGLPATVVFDGSGWDAADDRQHTLKAPIGCVGIGVHSGRRAQLRLVPAATGHGIVFRRVDLGIDIPARFDHVVDTRFCTVLGHDADKRAAGRHGRASDGRPVGLRRRQCAGRGRWAGSADPRRLGQSLRFPDRLRRPRRPGRAAPDDRGASHRARQRRRRLGRVAPGARPRFRDGHVDQLRRRRDRQPGAVAASHRRQFPPGHRACPHLHHGRGCGAAARERAGPRRQPRQRGGGGRGARC